MIRSIFFTLLLLGGINRGLADPDPIYINDTATSVTNVDVDATIFLNRGYFDADGVQFGSPIPWESSNTRFFTNSGVMTGTPGFRFDFIGYDGFTNPASAFLNTRTGNILASDVSSGGVIIFGSGGVIAAGGLFGLGASSRIEISANSITNQGLLQAGAGGVIQISGQDVDLSGSGVIIESLAESGATSGFFTGFSGFGLFIGNGGPFNFFIPDVGIYDLAWGISSDTNMVLAPIVQSAHPAHLVSPFFQVTNTLTGFRGTGTGTFNLGCLSELDLDNAASFVLTQGFSETNLTVQVVVVKTTDPNIVPQVNFINTGGQYLPALVELDSLATNLFTRQQITNSLFLIDELPTVSPTNFTLLENAGGQSVGLPTFRPVNFTLTRQSPFFLGIGNVLVPTNDVLTTSLLANGAYSNAFVTNIYAGYAAQIDSTAARLPLLPGVTVSNLPGRVEITAGNLNLNRSRIRGEGLVSVTASNFLGSPRALVDSQHLNYDLASPVQDITITNLAPETVQRLEGPLTAYSAIWTNQFSTISVVGTNSVTNLVEVKFHLLMVDGSGLNTIQPVTVHNLNLRSTSASSGVELQDNLFVGDNFRVEATNLTIRGRLTLGDGVPLDATSLINVKNFTNYGRLSLPALATFGGNTSIGLTDTNGRFSTFINRGEIQSLATLIRADYFENTGSIVSTNNATFTATNDLCLQTVATFTNFLSSIGAIEVNSLVSKLSGGSFGTAGDVRFLGGTAKFNDQALAAGGGLYFALTNVFTDTGPAAGNIWRTDNGFQMSEIPINRGNLFGTRIVSFADQFAIIQNTWAATDFGTNVVGFTNNFAIGQLALNSDFAGEFIFSGLGSRKALYVDRLEFGGDISSDLATLQDSLSLNDIQIYYADVLSTNSTITAETLDGMQLGSGTLHWVSDFAGPNSSVDVRVRANGQTNTVQFNRALRHSEIIDSDGDGIPNFFDPFPFDPAVENAPTIFSIDFSGTPTRINLSFNTVAPGSYRVESTDSLGANNWQLVTTYKKSGVNPSVATVTDTNMEGTVFRYYRVIYNP